MPIPKNYKYCIVRYNNRRPAGCWPATLCIITSLVREAIVYNVDRDESVPVGLLDTKLYPTQFEFTVLPKNCMIWGCKQRMATERGWLLCCIHWQKPGLMFCFQASIHHGAPFSVKLYQIFMNELILTLRGSRHRITVGYIDLTCSTFADDIDMLALYRSK